MVKKVWDQIDSRDEDEQWLAVGIDEKKR